MKSEVKLFQFVTGENVVGEIEMNNFSSDAIVTVKNPLFVVAQPTEDGKSVSIQLMPYSNLAKDNTIEVVFKNVVWYSTPEDRLANQYAQIFSTIVKPSPEQTKIVSS